MDQRDAARAERAALLVRTVQLEYNGRLSGFHVDDNETIFTEDEEGIWVRGWLLVCMEEQLERFKGSRGEKFYVEEHEQEHFIGKKGLWTGQWIRCWLRVPVDQGDMEDVAD